MIAKRQSATIIRPVLLPPSKNPNIATAYKKIRSIEKMEADLNVLKYMTENEKRHIKRVIILYDLRNLYSTNRTNIPEAVSRIGKSLLKPKVVVTSHSMVRRSDTPERMYRRILFLFISSGFSPRLEPKNQCSYFLNMTE